MSINYTVFKVLGFILFASGCILREYSKDSNILFVSKILTLIGLISIVIFAYKSKRVPVFYLIIMLLITITFLLVPYF